MKFITVCLVMMSLLSGGSARVVTDFQEECGEYFFREHSPTVLAGLQYKQICQTLSNISYYATLYDTHNKIPVYSAYMFKGCQRCKSHAWYIEPQLDDKDAGPNMAPDRGLKVNQACNSDYEGSGYEKGHLAPRCHFNSQSCVDATFTLTNAAPQVSSFNKQWFHHTEAIVKKIANTFCISETAYVVTGVVPGNSKIKNRVNVPSHFWSAYCCANNNNNLISGAVIAPNVEYVKISTLIRGIEWRNRFGPMTMEETELVNRFGPRTVVEEIVDELLARSGFLPMKVTQLEAKLSGSYGQNFRLFDEECRSAHYVPVEKEEKQYVPVKQKLYIPVGPVKRKHALSRCVPSHCQSVFQSGLDPRCRYCFRYFRSRLQHSLN